MEPPLCPTCFTRGVKSEMQYHHAYVFSSHFNNLVRMYAKDEAWKCPECRLVLKFGFPLTKEEFEKQKELWGGVVDWADEGKQQLIERLKALGYID